MTTAYSALDAADALQGLQQDTWRGTHGAHSRPFTLSWKGLRVKADQTGPGGAWLPCWPSRRGEKLVLDDVSGAVDGGSFLALVGASGAGKTTLLSAITRRLRGRAVTGDVLLNGRPASAQLMSRVCGFVPQHDIATETLTAMEHLTFMAAMRLDARTSAAARARRVRLLLGDLGLLACVDTRLANLSGGERRRLALAIQLLVSPMVLALDEPCSGLDADGSRVVLEALRREAGRGRAVLCTVHQAAPHLLRLFTDILVLAGGRVAFQGPLDVAEASLAQACPRIPADAIRCSSPSPVGLNAMLQQLCDPTAHLDTSRVCSAFSRSVQGEHLRTYPETEDVLSRDLIRISEIRRIAWWSQTSWLLWREATDAWRQNSRIATHLSIFVTTAFIMSMLFMNVNATSTAGIQSTRGMLYLIVSEVVYTNSYGVFYTFPAELPVYLRESHLYSSSAYYAAKVLSTMPRALIEPLIFVGVIQSQVDLTAGSGAVTFLAIVGILALAGVTASAYGCMLSAWFQTYEMAQNATMPIDFMCSAVAGIYNTILSLPATVSWIKFVSIFYYCHEMLSIVYWRNVSRLDCPAGPDQPCMRVGDEVLHDLGFTPDNLGFDLLGMGLLCVGLHTLGLLALYRRSRQQAAY